MVRRSPVHLMVAAALALPLALACAAETPVAEPSTDTPAATESAGHLAFAAALEACVAADHASPHPFVRGFTVEHTITGIDGEHCGYSQTMPGDMRMECKLGDTGRAGLADEFREYAQGRMSGGTGEQPAWTRDCEVVTADGKRMPIGKG